MKEAFSYGNFLGEDDDWKNNKDMSFWTKDKIMEAYKIAVEERYRFFSFGDCMLIL